MILELPFLVYTYTIKYVQYDVWSGSYFTWKLDIMFCILSLDMNYTLFSISFCRHQCTSSVNKRVSMRQSQQLENAMVLQSRERMDVGLNIESDRVYIPSETRYH